MDEFIRYYKKILMKILLFPLRVFPIKKNRVFLHNDLAYNYSCNPKYIAECLLDKYSGSFDIIFSVKHSERYIHLSTRGITVVRFNSFCYFFYALTSKVFLTNSGGFSYLPLRKETCVINTHHGGGAYKKMGRYMYNDSWLFKKDLLLSAKATTIFLSTCKKFTEIASDSLLLPTDIFWEIGMPRNDMLVHRDEQRYQAIRQRLGLKDNEKLVLYAPTYRKPNDNYFKESIAVSYGIDCERVCTALNKRFGGDWKFGFRLHPCIVNRNDIPKGNVIDLSDYEEMQELLLAADVMINDFSSSMWDYLLTGKPSFLFATDLEHYVKTTEVYTPVSEWPFPKSTNNDELEKNILEFDDSAYKAACERHYKQLGGCESGMASQLVCNFIKEKCFYG